MIKKLPTKEIANDKMKLKIGLSILIEYEFKRDEYSYTNSHTYPKDIAEYSSSF